MSETIRVKIIKCSKDTFWYSDRIGEIFEVFPNLDHIGRYNVVGQVLGEDSTMFCVITAKDVVVIPYQGKRGMRRIRKL